MGFNQRQAGGRFTADEAAELIDRLQQAEYEADQAEAAAPDPPVVDPEAKPPAMTDEARAEMERAVRSASTKSLVLEVRRRGWIVTKPE